MAMTGGNECYCGDLMPPLSTQVDNSKCDTACVGYPSDNCKSSLLACLTSADLRKVDPDLE